MKGPFKPNFGQIAKKALVLLTPSISSPIGTGSTILFHRRFYLRVRVAPIPKESPAHFVIKHSGHLHKQVANGHVGPGKNALVLVIGRVDFDANKKNAGRKINMTPRKIPSPEVSSLVNHLIHGHLHADVNVLGLQLHLVYILVYFCAMTLISKQVEFGFLVL